MLVYFLRDSLVKVLILERACTQRFPLSLTFLPGFFEIINKLCVLNPFSWNYHVPYTYNAKQCVTHPSLGAVILHLPDRNSAFVGCLNNLQRGFWSGKGEDIWGKPELESEIPPGNDLTQ